MNLPRARAGRTPMSSSVLTAEDEPDPELGVGGGGEPCIVGGMTRCMGGSVWMGGTPGGAEAGKATPTGAHAGGGGGGGGVLPPGGPPPPGAGGGGRGAGGAPPGGGPRRLGHRPNPPAHRLRAACGGS